MKLIRSVKGLRGLLDPARARGEHIGLVGTSGGMHAGHQSLIRRAAAENDISVLFWGGAPMDLDWHSGSTVAYQRDADRDFPIAEEAGCDLLFAPPGHVIFPEPPATTVSLPSFAHATAPLEDPAHLSLTALVMCKLWNMVGPCFNYFGEKDWQQLAMFIRLAKDLEFSVEVLGCPTVREDDGVAVSSRNAKMTVEERSVAPVLYRALSASRDAAQEGATNTAAVQEAFATVIDEVAEIHYFAAVDSNTMAPLDELAGSVRLLASIILGDVRLVDNIGIELPS